MTVWDLLVAMRRVWYVTVAGIVGTALAAGYVASHDGVYWSQVDVVFLAPQSARYPNNLSTTSGSLISTAGVVERLVNDGETGANTSSASATLVGQGIHDGYSIRLPDNGGQWAHNFNRQMLDVQVAGPSVEAVRELQARLIGEIERTLARLQREAGVSPQNYITTEPAALVPPVRYLPGERRRALAMTVLLGAGLTVTATAMTYRLVETSSARRERRAGQAVVSRQRPA